jgi:DNA-binding transcriptional regulator YiaG
VRQSKGMSELIDHLRLRRRLPTPPMRRAIRQSAGASQAAVAKAIGVDQRTIARWEAGERAPRGERLTAYMAVLDELRELADA